MLLLSCSYCRHYFPNHELCVIRFCIIVNISYLCKWRTEKSALNSGRCYADGSGLSPKDIRQDNLLKQNGSGLLFDLNKKSAKMEVLTC